MGFWAKFVYYSRTVLGVTLLSTCALYGVVASIVLSCVGKRHLAQWTTARSFYYVMGTFLGIEVEVINEENLKKLPAILVANHQSTLDILMLGRIFPPGCTVTAKSSLKWVPFLGWFMMLSGSLFLERGNREKSVRTLNNALDVMRTKKRAVWIFPEGTRSHSTKLGLLPFKKGAFHLAQQGKIPIIPIVVSNTSTLVNSKYKVFNRGVITVKVLDPIPTEDLKKEDVTAFTKRVEELMLKEVENLGYSDAMLDTNLPPEVRSSFTQVLTSSTVTDSEEQDVSTKDSVEEAVEALEAEDEEEDESVHSEPEHNETEHNETAAQNEGTDGQVEEPEAQEPEEQGSKTKKSNAKS
ncbi:LAQU0S01e03224g1_1 [Lachancea quebecensis]|uniref:1-acyl-sn-glycerol-3-phosphate acyltransferase n=1 Tax=Lachancea quebecensis TaxID=1654605 RepID=A0A0P1KLU1_9SACH|nr:LAQU0S01e03224g1_1 [Lachancea quebecensis]